MPDNIEERTKNDRIKKIGRIRCGCSGCVTTFIADNSVRHRHREICQFKTCDIGTGSFNEELFEEEDADGILPSEDCLYNYSCQRLTEGLLDLARQDAVREGDGERIYSFWKYHPLSFASTGHSNYAVLAFNFVVQIELLLSERKAAQLLQ